MPILNIRRNWGDNITIVGIITNDTLAQISTTGYLKAQQDNIIALNNGVFTFIPTDLILAMGTDGFEFFTVSADGNSLIPNIESGGTVLLPVINGDYAIFNGTSGQIKDSAQRSSNIANPFVVSSPGAVTINHIAQFADVNGSLKDGGVLGTAGTKAASNNALSTLASTAGSGFTVGHIVTAADAAGTVQDSGIASSAVQLSANIKANSVAWAGGGTSHAFTIAGLTTSSIVIPAIQAQTTGTVYIESYTITANTLTVTFSADPGAMVLQYSAFIAPQ